jgi:hypothetical protein
MEAFLLIGRDETTAFLPGEVRLVYYSCRVPGDGACAGNYA